MIAGQAELAGEQAVAAAQREARQADTATGPGGQQPPALQQPGIAVAQLQPRTGGESVLVFL